jgi:Zn-dependent protease with chaperone function
MFATAPLAPGSSKALPPGFQLCAIGLILLVFWQFNRYKFMKLRAALVSDLITISEGKKRYTSTTTIHLIFALFAFAVEIFLFDLKYFLLQIPFFGNLETSVNIAGLAIFILHLSMVWYWSFRAMGDIISIGNSAADHVKANIKFNLVIVIPWLCLSLLMDVIFALSTPSLIQWISSPLVQVVVFGLFLVALAIVAPAFIVWIWDCKPLEDPELKNTIDDFCRSRGVKFKDIMSWNALNGGLVTAGVLGLVTRFRYLLITPELIKLLDKDELLGVVSHEIGHVKKNHLRYYLVFFLAFMFLVVSISQLAGSLVSVSSLGRYIIINDGGPSNIIPFEYVTIFIFLFLFILYFRFIFGYFMRNFEREADIFCFHAEVNPDLLISSFHKLEEHMGGEEKKSNWHHYTIPQRVGFLRTCMENPQHAAAHEKKVKHAIKVFMAAMIIVVMFSSYMFIAHPTAGAGIVVTRTQVIAALEKEAEKNSDNPVLYSTLGELYYQVEKWEKAKKAYENSIQLNYQQSGVLNNLAWLLLKCPDEKLRDPKRALKLAEDAVDLNENSFHSLDTLAEAYFQNSRYKEAFYAAQRAYLLATENRSYYEKQLKKMAKYYKTFKSTITI